MAIEKERVDELADVKKYHIEFPISRYIFPTEALIQSARVDEQYLHVELTDKRILSIPLFWIPTLYNAAPAQRIKFEINASRTMLIWDPDKTGINDEISIADYLGPITQEIRESTDNEP